TEWKLLQMDVSNPDNGSSQLSNSGKHGSGKHAVVRRYEFYKYTGPVMAPGTRADKQGIPYPATRTPVRQSRARPMPVTPITRPAARRAASRSRKRTRRSR